MIAVDANILVYACREDAPRHARAQRTMEQLENGADEWSIPSSCLREFFRAVTHPENFQKPTTRKAAREQIEYWLTPRNVVVLCEHDDYWECLDDAIESGEVTSKHVHDAHIAAICITHGVSELWTADKGFKRFPGLKVHHPFPTDEPEATPTTEQAPQ